MKNPVSIIAIGTAVPGRALGQKSLGDRIMQALPPGDRRLRLFAHRLYRDGGIRQRHTILESFPESGPGLVAETALLEGR